MDPLRTIGPPFVLMRVDVPFEALPFVCLASYGNGNPHVLPTATSHGTFAFDAKALEVARLLTTFLRVGLAFGPSGLRPLRSTSRVLHL